MAVLDQLRRRVPLPVGLLGASTGAAAALVVAATRRSDISAVVSRGGRPDLAGDTLPSVKAPTLLIVGGADMEVLDLNRKAIERMAAEVQLEIVRGASHLFHEPGALETVAELAANWFTRFIVDLVHRPSSIVDGHSRRDRMKRREIAREEWQEFFDSFSGPHEGWLVGVDRFDEFLDERVETHHRDGALRGVQSEDGSIALAVDDRTSGHLETEGDSRPTADRVGAVGGRSRRRPRDRWRTVVHHPEVPQSDAFADGGRGGWTEIGKREDASAGPRSLTPAVRTVLR